MADKTAEPSLLPIENDNQTAASQLSAMIDDALAEREIDLALRRLSRDSEAQDRWERYYLISDTLKGHLPDALDLDFAGRIRQLIDAEPMTPAVSKPLPAWRKLAAGFGLAASVVLVGLFGLQLTQTDQPLSVGSAPGVAASATNTVLPVASIAGMPRSRGAAAKSPTETRLNSYLASHNSASLNGVSGALPSYARLVGYQTNR
jgi:sigma-E factor negative regulatory protein RseA